MMQLFTFDKNHDGLIERGDWAAYYVARSREVASRVEAASNPNPDPNRNRNRNRNRNPTLILTVTVTVTLTFTLT